MDASDETPLDGASIHDEIARLEAESEAKAASLERCRKISIAARVAIAIGAAWLALVLVRVIPYAPVHFVGAIAAMLGGIVLFGSNSSTRKQTEAALAAAETRRSELIDRIELMVVQDAGIDDSGGRPPLH
jgi:hypothetical protein